MLAMDGQPAVHFTDIGRFTGRSPRVLGKLNSAAESIGMCSVSTARFDEQELFNHLNALAEALSPSIVWLLTDCDAHLAVEVGKWCERRQIFWHYCTINDVFAFARR